MAKDPYEESYREELSKKYKIPEREQVYQDLLKQYQDLMLGQFGLASAFQKGMKQQQPEFSLGQKELQARYGTEGSGSYIENPNVRQSVIQRDIAGGKQTLGDLLQSAQGMYGQQVTGAQFGAERAMSDYEKALARMAEEMDWSERARKQKFYEQLSLAQLAAQQGGGGGGGYGYGDGDEIDLASLLGEEEEASIPEEETGEPWLPKIKQGLGNIWDYINQVRNRRQRPSSDYYSGGGYGGGGGSY